MSKNSVMIKQCGYCFRILGDDGVYHNIGLADPVVQLRVAPPKTSEVAVSHGICSDCFQVMIAPADKEIEGNGLLKEKPARVEKTTPSTKAASVRG
ncbi:MAG: hypothetical protein HOC91_15890 [Nitrospinaceae bacterium]|jgi:hypothetical protein|nr:hypothetical protein [Nitrospinaceae bacterium]MBT3434095.1 hypothetical protein [Nitrospinaceae bacterium]MBT4094632.1 hypothetical protein [Nitrospinaceae bacterium]MBT4431990.1 hypothetical protein [Nitrospinaceae bacterium]MBT5366459.1 hypothetical protein [Nitrospinaceae bacterium]